MPSVMCVTGTVADTDLGLVLPHEHLFVDLSCYCPPEPEDTEGRAFYHQSVSRANRGQVVNDPWGIVDNTRLDSLESAVHEVGVFAGLGGKTISDLSPCPAMGRNPVGLLRVSEATGVQVIMSAGRYVLPSMTEEDKRLGLEGLEGHLLAEFVNGVDGIRPGLLKTGFVSKINDEAEVRSLRAVARVQAKVGCAVAVHPYIWEPMSHKILDIMEDEGCDLRRVILCHQDFLGSSGDYLDSLIRRGAYVEFDTFGSGWLNDPMWKQSDREKIGFLVQQVERGNTEHLLISGDMCLKIMFSRWGGAGYAHIPERVIPSMKLAGLGDDMIRAITTENAVRVLCH